MGNAESQPVRNVDKRTARRDHAPLFKGALSRYRFELQQAADAASEADADDLSSGRLRVAVRRRPIFPHETGAGEFDVVSCKHKNIVIHDCRMHPDCRRLFVSHNTFTFDRVYDEHCSSADVYAGSVAPLVSMAATQCKAATVYAAKPVAARRLRCVPSGGGRRCGIRAGEAG